MLVMKVVYVYPDMNDNTMALPELILPLLNADFDGDVLNIHSLKIDDIKNVTGIGDMTFENIKGYITV